MQPYKRYSGDYWRLEGKIPVPCTQAEYLEYFKIDRRRVIQETIEGYWVSTVFLPTYGDYYFETMIFDRRERADNLTECYCVRTATWELALDAHREAVEWIKDQRN